MEHYQVRGGHFDTHQPRHLRSVRLIIRRLENSTFLYQMASRGIKVLTISSIIILITVL